MKKKILFTKKISLKEYTLFKKKFSIYYKNFIKIIPLTPKQIPTYNNIIITSSITVDNLIKLYNIHDLKNKNYYLVGKKSEKKLKNITQNIKLVTENSQQLAEYLITIPQKTFTYFGSNIKLPIIEKILYTNGKIVKNINIYNTILNPIKINKFYNAIIFMSPSAVKSFFTLNKTISLKTYIFALGETTAKSFYMYSKSFNHSVIIPKKTNLNSLINCIQKNNLFNNQQ